MNESKNDFPQSESTLPVQPKHTAHRKGFALTMGMLVFVIGIGVGYGLESLDSSSAGAAHSIDIDRSEDHTSDNVSFDEFWDAWDLVNATYVDQPVNEQELLYGAIRGMVAGLGDPYSSFFDPEESKEFIDEIQGNFEGIGAEIGIRDERLTVISPLNGSPAETAGLFAGDVIIAIDGLDASFMSLPVAIDAIRGDKGTDVVLTVYRKSSDTQFDITITRDTIELKSVDWELVDAGEQTVGYVELHFFDDQTTAEFHEAVDAMRAKNADGLILDLRGNPGGYLPTAVDILSFFVPKDEPVVWKQEYGQDDEPLVSTGDAQLKDMPVVILIDQGSASASEIVAATLEEYSHAVLIGDTSFGKGTVQDIRRLADGSALKITIGRWLSKDKRSVDKTGIAPTYRIERTAEDVNADKDPQYDAALKYFTDTEAFTAANTVYIPEKDESTTTPKDASSE